MERKQAEQFQKGHEQNQRGPSCTWLLAGQLWPLPPAKPTWSNSSRFLGTLEESWPQHSNHPWNLNLCLQPSLRPCSSQCYSVETQKILFKEGERRLRINTCEDPLMSHSVNVGNYQLLRDKTTSSCYLSAKIGHIILGKVLLVIVLRKKKSSPPNQSYQPCYWEIEHIINYRSHYVFSASLRTIMYF